MDYQKKFFETRALMLVIAIVIILLVFLWRFLTHRVSP